MPATPILSPAPFVPNQALAYADVDGTAINVSAASPLPVNLASAAPLAVNLATVAATALAGTASASGVFGPYQPVVGRSVMLTLSGSWTGQVKVTRSTDGGTTRQPLTAGGIAWGQYTANCCEPVWDESDGAARLYLEVTLSAGTLVYRMAQ